MIDAANLVSGNERVVLRHLLRAETELAQAMRRCTEADVAARIEAARESVERLAAHVRVRLDEVRVG